MSYEQIASTLAGSLKEGEIAAVVEELEQMESGEAAYLAIKIVEQAPEQRTDLLRALKECLPGAF